MLPARVISVSINRSAADVYAFAHQPVNFPKWAAGLSNTLTQDGGRWIAATPAGTAEVVFTPPNDFGILDHWVKLATGATVYVPLRVIPNRDGAEVQFTLFREPDMSEADMARDAGLITKDLAALKALLEA